MLSSHVISSPGLGLGTRKFCKYFSFLSLLHHCDVIYTHRYPWLRDSPVSVCVCDPGSEPGSSQQHGASSEQAREERETCSLTDIPGSGDMISLVAWQ